MPDRAHAVAQLRSRSPRQLRDLLHRARQCSCAIAQQTAVRGVVNVSFHHRRIHPQPLPSRNLFLLGYGHQSLMNLLDHIWAEGLQQPSQGLRIRNFLCSDPRKLPVDDIGPHLTLGLLKAPVPHVLQYRQPQRNLGGRLLPPTATALRPSSPLGFVNGVQQLLVVQHLVGLLHPLFPPPRRFFGKPRSVGLAVRVYEAGRPSAGRRGVALGRPASSTLPTTPTLLRETIPPTSSVGGIAVQPSARLSVAVGFLSFILRCNCSRFSAAIAQARSQNSFHAACAWRASSTCLAGTYNARFFPSL